MNVKLLVALVCRLKYVKENCSLSRKRLFYNTIIFQNFFGFVSFHACTLQKEVC